MILFVEQDVAWLEIAMHDAGFMRGDETGRDLARNGERAGDREPAFTTDHLGEVRPVDVRHRDVLDAVDLAEIVNANDILVGHVPGEQQFAFEAPLQVAHRGCILEGLGANDLDRHDHRELFVPCLVHGTHPALAKRANEVIAAPEPRSRLQGCRRRACQPDGRCLAERPATVGLSAADGGGEVTAIVGSSGVAVRIGARFWRESPRRRPIARQQGRSQRRDGDIVIGRRTRPPHRPQARCEAVTMPPQCGHTIRDFLRGPRLGSVSLWAQAPG